MSIREEWQLVIADGHGLLKGISVIHIFETKEEAVDFFAREVTAPALLKGEKPPGYQLVALMRHEHRSVERMGGDPHEIRRKSGRVVDKPRW